MGNDLISREALERIIKRAAELQAGERDIGEGLTSNEVLSLGKDVGIPDRYLRQAMLEEQTRITPEVATGTWAWLTGPRSIIAHRVVPGERASVERAVSRWMTEEALLQPKRHYPDRTSWEPKAGRWRRFSARWPANAATHWRRPRRSPRRLFSSSLDSAWCGLRRISGRSAPNASPAPPCWPWSGGPSQGRPRSSHRLSPSRKSCCSFPALA